MSCRCQAPLCARRITLPVPAPADVAIPDGDPVRGLRNGLLLAIPFWFLLFSLVGVKGCP